MAHSRMDFRRFFVDSKNRFESVQKIASVDSLAPWRGLANRYG